MDLLNFRVQCINILSIKRKSEKSESCDFWLVDDTYVIL